MNIPDYIKAIRQPWYIERCSTDYPVFKTNPICWIFAKLFYERWINKTSRQMLARQAWINSMTNQYINHLKGAEANGTTPQNLDDFVLEHGYSPEDQMRIKALRIKYSLN